MIPPVVGRPPEPYKSRAPGASHSGFSGPGIASISIALVMGLCTAVGVMMLREANPQSLAVRLFWPAVLFGLGAGAGLGAAGAAQQRRSTAIAWIGLLLNLAVFAGITGLSAISKPPVQGAVSRDAPPPQRIP